MAPLILVSSGWVIIGSLGEDWELQVLHNAAVYPGVENVTENGQERSTLNCCASANEVFV